MNQNRNSLSISTICLIILLIVLVVADFHQHRETNAYNQQIHSERLTTQYYQSSKSKYTLQGLRHKYDTTEPNLYEIIKANKNNISNGLNTAFNKSHTSSEYNHNKVYIEKCLGSSISSEILPVIKPGYTEDAKSRKRQSVSQSLERYRISYGKYNNTNYTIPVNIVLTYKSIPYNQNESGYGKVQYKSHSDVITISGTLFTNNNYIQVNRKFDQAEQMD